VGKNAVLSPVFDSLKALGAAYLPAGVSEFSSTIFPKNIIMTFQGFSLSDLFVNSLATVWTLT
jgi:hypothetical protein